MADTDRRGGLRRLLPRLFGRVPARAPGGEAAGRSVGDRLQPYIGELPAHPGEGARYASAWSDDRQALQIYRHTLRDERCRAALDQRLNAAIARPWEVEPGGEDALDKAAAENIATQLKGFEFDAACRQLLHGVWYGYAIAEVMWARDGDRVVLADLLVRSPDRFRWTPGGEPLLCTLDSPAGVPLEPAKFVVLRRPGEHADVPFGPGLARWCFWPVWLKRHGLKFWSVALEKFSAPTAVGTYPPGASQPEQDRLLELVQEFATGVAVTLPEGQDVKLVEAARRTGGDFQTFVEFLDRATTTTILGQSSTTDQGPWRGTAEVQQDVRDETVAADCRLLDSALNSSIARWLTAWNFPGAAVPAIRRNVEPADDLDARIKREEIIANIGGLRPTRGHIETVYGGEWEDAPPPPAGPPPADAALAAVAARRPRDTIDGAVDDLLAGDGWEPLMEPVIEPILAAAGAALARGDSLEDFRLRLPTLFAEMDDNRLVETLRRMGFSAALSGRAGLAENGGDA